MKHDFIQLGYITYHAVKLKLYRDEWYMSGLKSDAQDVVSLCDQYNIRWTALQLWYHVCFWFSSFFWCTTLQWNIHVLHGERRNTSSQVRRINIRLEYEEPLQKRHLSGKTATRLFVQQLVQPTKKKKTSKLRIVGNFWGNSVDSLHKGIGNGPWLQCTIFFVIFRKEKSRHRIFHDWQFLA